MVQQLIDQYRIYIDCDEVDKVKEKEELMKIFVAKLFEYSLNDNLKDFYSQFKDGILRIQSERFNKLNRALHEVENLLFR